MNFTQPGIGIPLQPQPNTQPGLGCFGVDARGMATTPQNSDRLWRLLASMTAQRNSLQSQVNTLRQQNADLLAQIQSLSVAQARAAAAASGGGA